MAQGYYTLEEAAQLLRMTADELKALSRKGELRSFQDRGTWRFRIAEIEELARRRGVSSSDPEGPIAPAAPRSVTQSRPPTKMGQAAAAPNATGPRGSTKMGQAAAAPPQPNVAGPRGSTRMGQGAAPATPPPQPNVTRARGSTQMGQAAPKSPAPQPNAPKGRPGTIMGAGTSPPNAAKARGGTRMGQGAAPPREEPEGFDFTLEVDDEVVDIGRENLDDPAPSSKRIASGPRSSSRGGGAKSPMRSLGPKSMPPKSTPPKSNPPRSAPKQDGPKSGPKSPGSEQRKSKFVSLAAPGSDSDVRIVGDEAAIDFNIQVDSDVKLGRTPPPSPKQAGPSSSKRKQPPLVSASPDSGVRLVPPGSDSDVRLVASDSNEHEVALGAQGPRSASDSDIRMDFDIEPTEESGMQIDAVVDLDAEIRHRTKLDRQKKKSQYVPAPPKPQADDSPFELGEESYKLPRTGSTRMPRKSAPAPDADSDFNLTPASEQAADVSPESEEEFKLELPDDDTSSELESAPSGSAAAAPNAGVLYQEEGADAFDFDIPLEDEPAKAPPGAARQAADSSDEMQPLGSDGQTSDLELEIEPDAPVGPSPAKTAFGKQQDEPSSDFELTPLGGAAVTGKTSLGAHDESSSEFDLLVDDVVESAGPTGRTSLGSADNSSSEFELLLDEPGPKGKTALGSADKSSSEFELVLDEPGPSGRTALGSADDAPSEFELSLDDVPSATTGRTALGSADDAPSEFELSLDDAPSGHVGRTALGSADKSSSEFELVLDEPGPTGRTALGSADDAPSDFELALDSGSTGRTALGSAKDSSGEFELMLEDSDSSQPVLRTSLGNEPGGHSEFELTLDTDQQQTSGRTSLGVDRDASDEFELELDSDAEAPALSEGQPELELEPAPGSDADAQLVANSDFDMPLEGADAEPSDGFELSIDGRGSSDLESPDGPDSEFELQLDEDAQLSTFEESGAAELEPAGEQAELGVFEEEVPTELGVYEEDLELPVSADSDMNLEASDVDMADGGEFELEAFDGSEAGAEDGGQVELVTEEDQDIFETGDGGMEFDESASDAVAVEEDEGAVDLESSDFDLAFEEDGAAMEEESGSVVVAIEEEEEGSDPDAEVAAPGRGRRKLADVDGEFGELGEDEDFGADMPAEDMEDEEPREVIVEREVAVAPWGAIPVLVMFPCVILLFLVGLMGFEMVQGMSGYKQPGTVTRAISGMIGMDMKQ